ncbi:GH25 family lysozyme [Arthrobacter sp. Soc17.1.1.1]|uniref:GH25 family lysozyme n=1 Tax=Arthrobacter sp. Soc17.1.1.1 TaxID=3121277 RepID=UPI002FE4DEAB
MSSWQGSVDWTTVWNTGARFAYVKASEGPWKLNDYFNQQYNGSAAVGMFRGAYHFARPNLSSGKSQAEVFVRSGGGWTADGKTLPGALDLETNMSDSSGDCYGLTPAQLTGWTKDFTTTYRALTGRDAPIYTTYYFWQDCLGGSTAFSTSNPLWIAHWQVDHTRVLKPGGWSTFTFWQFDDHGALPVDQNVFNGSLDALRQFAVGRAVSAYASYFKYSNMPSIYGRLPNGTFRALSWDEYSQLGQPGYQTLGPVSFVMNSWNGTIYLIGADNKGQILSFQDWDAYGRPNPTVSKLIPGTYFTTKFDSKLYYMSPAGEIPATDADYKAAGSPPLTLPTRYVKYDWDTTVYQQKATSLTASTATTVSHDQWAAAGFPAPQVISYIPGTTFFKYTNLGTIFMKTPTGATHPATYDEWRSAPLSAQGYTDAGQARFVMNSWNGTIYLIGADNKGQILSFQDWDAYGRPNPTVSKLIPGTYFTTKFDSKLYYMSPAGEIPATDADYKAAGSPPLTLPTRYVKYDWDTTVYQQKATSLTASTATTVSHDQWAAAGFPAPQVISYIPGTTFFKYTNLGTIFMKTPTGATHPATYDEWRSAPLSAQGYTDAGQARFVMNSWNGTIYLIGADNKGQILSFQDWDAYGRPNPTVSKLIPGTYFTRSDNKLYYMSPAGQIPATDADYKAAGSPPIRTR